LDDITVGNNTNHNASQYLAAPGYDLCTGWGSPAGGSLILALARPDGLQITPGRGAVASGPAGGPFTVTSQTFELVNTGNSACHWTLGGGPAWLSVSGTNGSLAAGAGTAVTVTANAAAASLTAGVYTAGLWFTNQTSGLAQLRQFTLLVARNLAQDGGFEAGDFCYWNLTGDAGIYTNNFVDDGTYTGYSPYAGNYFAVLAQISDLAWLSQPIPTRAGQFYVVSFWLANPGGATPNQFQVRWNTNAAAATVIYTRTNLGGFDWTYEQFLVQATTSVTTLQFGARNDNGFFALDNVSVQPAQFQPQGALEVFLDLVLNGTGLGTAATPDLRARSPARPAVTNAPAGGP
jgi:hypothetical protein